MALTASTSFKSSGFHFMQYLLVAGTSGEFTDAQTADIDGFVTGVEFQMGADVGLPIPTANSDITLKDAGGLDILGGKGANLSGETGIFTRPYDAVEEAYVPERPVRGKLTVGWTNNSVEGAQLSMKVYFRR